MAGQQQRIATALRAVRVMRTVIDRRGKLELAWQKECDRARLPPHQRRLLRDVCSGTLRWLEYYGRLIDFMAPTHLADDLELRLLAASTLYQSENMQKAPDQSTLRRAAADCCSQLGKPHAANGIKELCRRVLVMDYEDRRQASTEASTYSLPTWLHAKLERDVQAKRWLRASGHLLLERPDFLNVCVPPEAVYGGPSRYAQMLRRDEGLRAEPSAIAPHGVLIRSRPRDVEALPGIAKNIVHVQDTAQQYACSLLRPLGEGERVLDACAAPGGKSRALLFHHPHAFVTAVDTNGKKVSAMREALHASQGEESTRREPDPDASVRADARQASGQLSDGGLLHRRRSQMQILHADVTDVASWWDGIPFSAAVVDPPCTASGLLRTIPEVKAHRTEADLTILRRMQLHMLRSIWPLIKPGGELLYTTCSILKDENDVVVATFLKRTADATPAVLQLPSGSASLTARRRKHGALLFYPSEIHQGGYAALLRREE